MQLRVSNYLHDVMRGNDGGLDDGGSEESGMAEMGGKRTVSFRQEDVITGLPMVWLEVHPRNRQPAGSVAVGGRCACYGDRTEMTECSQAQRFLSI